MPTTPLRGWPYPAYEENPYYTTIVSTFEAMDTDVHTLRSRLRYMWSTTADSSAITTTGLQSFDLSHTLPAGVLNVVGAVIRVRMGGKMTTPVGTTTMFFAISLGPAYVAGSAAMITNASLSNQDWTVEAVATIRASSTIYPSPGYADLGLEYLDMVPRQAPYTATLSGTLVVGAQVNWPGAGHSITMTDFLIEVLHPGP